jgi:hypothetical protein
MNDEQGYNLCKCTPCVLIHIMLSCCSLEHPICVEKPNASMTVKNGINQIGILVGGASVPRISKVIHAITEEAARRHKLAIMNEGFKHLMQENLVGMPLTREVVGYICLGEGSMLHIYRANRTKSPAALQQFFLTLENAGIDGRISIDGVVSAI